MIYVVVNVSRSPSRAIYHHVTANSWLTLIYHTQQVTFSSGIWNVYTDELSATEKGKTSIIPATEPWTTAQATLRLFSKHWSMLDEHGRPSRSRGLMCILHRARAPSRPPTAKCFLQLSGEWHLFTPTVRHLSVPGGSVRYRACQRHSVFALINALVRLWLPAA